MRTSTRSLTWETARPIFIIAGSDDDDVPPPSTRALMAAAHQPKTLWTIEGAHHGDYGRYAGAEYDRRVVEFYDRALSGPGGAL